MSYRPDYERALNEAAQTVMPQTPEDWGLVALSGIGIWFVWLVVGVVLDAARDSFARTQREAATPEPIAPAEQ